MVPPFGGFWSALSGRLKMDPFGVMVLASVTAIGGGTIRDMALGDTCFWIKDTNHLWVIMITCALTMLLCVARKTRMVDSARQ